MAKNASACDILSTCPSLAVVGPGINSPWDGESFLPYTDRQRATTTMAPKVLWKPVFLWTTFLYFVLFLEAWLQRCCGYHFCVFAAFWDDGIPGAVKTICNFCTHFFLCHICVFFSFVVWFRLYSCCNFVNLLCT